MSVKELSHSELLLLPQFPQVPLSRQAFELDCLRSFLFTREPHKFRSMQLYFIFLCNPTHRRVLWHVNAIQLLSWQNFGMVWIRYQLAATVFQ